MRNLPSSKATSVPTNEVRNNFLERVQYAQYSLLYINTGVKLFIISVIFDRLVQ